MSEQEPTPPGGALALQDIRSVVDGAIAVAGGLLTAGERVMARRIAALEGPAGYLYARLSSRQGEIFRLDRISYAEVPHPDRALAELIGLDLAHENVPPSLAIGCYTLPELAEFCAALGLPKGGRRAELELRLEGKKWPQGRIFRLCGKALLRRLERLWLRRVDADRTELLLERLGVRRWVEYRPTGGGSPFPTRGAMLELEEALRAPALSAEQALARVRGAQPRPAYLRHLDPRRIWVHQVIEAARGLERGGEPARAALVYAGLLEAGLRRPAEVAQRLALSLDAAGDREGALAACLSWIPKVDPSGRLSIERTGRRLARALRRPWKAAAPLREAPVRQLQLTATGSVGARPSWEVEGLTIEQAVVHRLAPRPALHGENALWTTLFGLLFFDLYWLPVRDMLPVPFLAGPLDLGSPDFALNRKGAVEARLEAIAAGQGPAHMRAVWERHAGAQVAGVDWSLASIDALCAIADGCGPALVEILGRLTREGWSIARGLPDLVILPGVATRIEGAVPGHLDEGLLFAEIKGPTDALRDDQRVWLDRLLAAGLRVELWQVVEAS